MKKGAATAWWLRLDHIIPQGMAYMWFSSVVFASRWRAGAIGAGGGGGGAEAQAASDRARAARADRQRIRVIEIL